MATGGHKIYVKADNPREARLAQGQDKPASELECWWSIPCCRILGCLFVGKGGKIGPRILRSSFPSYELLIVASSGVIGLKLG